MELIEKMMPAKSQGGFSMEGYWVWCGSVVKGEDGRYHMFASRWPKKYPMHPGWLMASEVVRAVSDSPEGPYEFAEVVLGERGAQYWDGRATHNPHIIKYKDNYILYYMGTTHPFHEKELSEEPLNDPKVIVARANKRIGMATSKSIFGPWKRLDGPILQTRPEEFDSFLTSNPAPCINEDGSVLLMYKARAYNKPPYTEQLHGKMVISVARADRWDGEYKQLTHTPIFSAESWEIEDPFIWKKDDGYAMIAKDMNGNICGEKHSGVYAESRDGIKWDMHLGKKSYSRKVLWDDGVVREMGSLERPFILFEEGKPTHMFFATADGSGGFRNASRTWNMVIGLKDN